MAKSDAADTYSNGSEMRRAVGMKGAVHAK
jgi:hypothetical protein